MRENIKYRQIMDLGFKEEFRNDNVYFDEYGYEYAVITLDLTDTIHLDWTKETQLCNIIRIDNKEDCNILAEHPIKTLDQLKTIIKFFE